MNTPRSNRWTLALAGLCLLLGGRLVWESLDRGPVWSGDPLAAQALAAAGVSRVGPLTILTVDVGNEDALVIADDRAEQLLVYRVRNDSSAELVQRVSLPRVFLDGRSRAQGRGQP